MHGNSESRTSASLLARLRVAPADQTAWSEFVDRYGGKVYGWCRHWGLQEADAQDVTQDVLVRLADKMRGFDQEVLEEAIERVRARVIPQSWRVFELTAHEGRSGAETAAVLGMTVAAVFVAKSRVQKLLQDEVRKLEGSEPA